MPQRGHLLAMMMEDTTTEQLLGDCNDLEDGKLGNVNLDGMTLDNGRQEFGIFCCVTV